MKCTLCKTKEATNHHKDLHICDSCLIEIQLSVRYYVGGEEVTPQEYHRKWREANGQDICE